MNPAMLHVLKQEPRFFSFWRNSRRCAGEGQVERLRENPDSALRRHGPAEVPLRAENRIKCR